MQTVFSSRPDFYIELSFCASFAPSCHSSPGAECSLPGVVAPLSHCQLRLCSMSTWSELCQCCFSWRCSVWSTWHVATFRCHYVQQQHGTVCVLCKTMVPRSIITHLWAAAPRSISMLIGGENGYNKDDELHVVTKFLWRIVITIWLTKWTLRIVDRDWMI